MDVRLYHDSVVMLNFKATNRSVGALVDTGAAVPCCTLSLPRCLLPTYKSQIVPSDKCFSTVNGKSFTPIGVISLHFNIGSLTLSEKFYVFPQLNRSLILDRTFLHGSHAMLDFTSHSLKLDTSYPNLNSFPYTPVIDVITWSVSRAMQAAQTSPGTDLSPHTSAVSDSRRPLHTSKPNDIESEKQIDRSLPGPRDCGDTPRSSKVTSKTQHDTPCSGFREPGSPRPPVDTTPGSDVAVRADNIAPDKFPSHNSCDNNATTAYIEGLDHATIPAKQRTHGPFLDLINSLQHGLVPPTKKRYTYCVARENTHGLHGPHQLLVVHVPNRDNSSGVHVLIPPVMRPMLLQLYHDKLFHHSGMFKT